MVVNSHICPKCGADVPCTAVRKPGQGRQGILGTWNDTMKPRHYIVLSILQERPTTFWHPNDILQFLREHNIERPRTRGVTRPWTWNGITSPLSDLVGRFHLVEMMQPENGIGRAWYYRSLLPEITPEVIQHWREGHA